jgi:hypothetical protein
MKDIQTRRFLPDTWEMLTDWAREVTDRVNAPWQTTQLEDACVTAPKIAALPGTSIYSPSGQSIATGPTPSAVQFTETNYEQGGAEAPVFDKSLNRLVVKRAGRYLVHARAGFLPLVGVAAGANINVTITKNGATAAAGILTVVLGGHALVHVVDTIVLDVDDAIALLVGQNTGNAQSLYNVVGYWPTLAATFVGGL